MRFQVLSAALVAATAFISGVTADGAPAATTTLTRTLQRVVQTVTSTRPDSTGTGAPIVNGTAIAHNVPSATSASLVTATPGAAANLHFDTAGLLAAAGLVGYLAL